MSESTTNGDVRPFPGAMRIEDMTDRQLLEENVYWLRTVGQALAEFQNKGPASIMRMLMGGN